MYADPRWVRGQTARYIVGPEEMQDRKGHCPIMVTREMKVAEPGENQDEEQELHEEGVSLPTPVRWPEEGVDGKWLQWVQQVHVERRRRSHVHRTMRKAPKVCGFSRPVGGIQTQPKLQQLVAKLKKGQQEEVEVRAKAERGTGRRR